MKAKLYIVFICLLSSPHLHAQQEWEYINKQFGQWQIGTGLSPISNSLEKLNIRNATGESISNTQKTLNYRLASLNMNWKESNPFEISFKLSNEKSSPYQYKEEQVYWGISLELYKTDGSVISESLWLSANQYESISGGEITSRYSYNANNEGWVNWKYREEYLKELDVIIICSGNYLSAGFKYYPVNTYIGEVEYRLDEYRLSGNYSLNGLTQYIANNSNIAGIKSISIMVGSNAEVSVTGFYAKRKTFYGMAKSFVDKGDEYMNERMWNEAIKEYTKAINQNYQNADIYIRRAYANMMNNYNANAIDDCNKALAYDNNNEVAYYIRGISKLKNDDDSGVSDLRKAGEDGIAFLKEFGLLDYYPNQNNSNVQKHPKTVILPNTLKKDPNFKIK